MDVPVVGFISPPRWASPSITEFPAVIEGTVLAQQSFPHLPGFDYALSSVASAHEQVCAAGRMLGEAGCRAVAMEGTPFAWAGLGTEAEARQRVADLSVAAGVPGLMAGTSIVDAVRSLGARRVALCPTYYPPDWRDAWCRFVSACGIEVVYCRTMADEGLVAAVGGVDDYGWRTGPHLVRAAVERAASSGADVIVVTGAGSRTSPIIAELEEIADAAVVGADTALFWAMAHAAEVALKPRSLGRLTRMTPG